MKARIARVKQFNTVSPQAAVMADFIAVSLNEIPAPVLHKLANIVQEYYQFDDFDADNLKDFLLNLTPESQQAILAYAFQAAINSPADEKSEINPPIEKAFQLIGDRLSFRVALYAEEEIIRSVNPDDCKAEQIIGSAASLAIFAVVYRIGSEAHHLGRLLLPNEPKPNLFASSLELTNDPVQMKQLVKQEFAKFRASSHSEIKHADVNILSPHTKTSSTHRRVLNLEPKQTVVNLARDEAKEVAKARSEVLSEAVLQGKNIKKMSEFKAVPQGDVVYRVSDEDDTGMLVDKETQEKLDEQLAQKLRAQEDTSTRRNTPKRR